MRGWNSKTLDWYLQAGEHSQYPKRVLNEIVPHLKPEHIVLDIGCGPGLYALTIAPLVNRVLAMDRQALALEKLEALARQRGLKNIRCIVSDWPQAEMRDEVGIIISAFSSGQVMNSCDSIGRMLSLKPQGIFLVAPGEYTPPFGWSAATDSNPNFEDTTSLLTRMGLNYKVKQMSIDFGQPVRDLEEGAVFLSWFLNISDSTARKHLNTIATPHSHGLYLPNPRNVVLIQVNTK